MTSFYSSPIEIAGSNQDVLFIFCRQYLYVDEKNKKCKCPAPDYVNLVMSDCQKSIKDESVFPTKYGKLQLVISGITKSSNC